MVGFIKAHQKLINPLVRYSFLPRLGCATRAFRQWINGIKLIPKRFDVVVVIGDVKVTLLNVGYFSLELEDGALLP